MNHPLINSQIQVKLGKAEGIHLLWLMSTNELNQVSVLQLFTAHKEISAVHGSWGIDLQSSSEA